MHGLHNGDVQKLAHKWHAQSQSQFRPMIRSAFASRPPHLNGKLCMPSVPIWTILEQKACKVSHSSVEVLKQKLTESWDEIDFETVRATCAQVSERLRRVIRAKGGYIE